MIETVKAMSTRSTPRNFTCRIEPCCFTSANNVSMSFRLIWLAA